MDHLSNFVKIKLEKINKMFIDMVKKDYITFKDLYLIADLQIDLNKNGSGKENFDVNLFEIIKDKYIEIIDNEDVRNILNIKERVLNKEYPSEFLEIYQLIAMFSLLPYKKLICFADTDDELIEVLNTNNIPYSTTNYEYNENGKDIQDRLVIVIPTPQTLDRLGCLKKFFVDEEDYFNTLNNIWNIDYISQLSNYSKSKNLLSGLL